MARHIHMASKRIAVITAGTEGLGLLICSQLASPANDILVILTAKDEQKGLRALHKLKTSGASANIIFQQLDVTNLASITAFVDFIGAQFGKIDILVHNTGINGTFADSLDLHSGEVMVANTDMEKQVMLQTYETAKDCIQTNYYGTKHVTEALLPFLHSSTSPKIVNISSGIAKIKNIPDMRVSKMFKVIKRLAEEAVKEIVTEFLFDNKDGSLKKNGWNLPLWAYSVSKAVINAYTRVVQVKKYPDSCINTVNPGVAKTDMTHCKGKYIVEEGAKDPVSLAFIADEAVVGLPVISFSRWKKQPIEIETVFVFCLLVL